MYIIHEISQIESQQECDGEKGTMTHWGRVRVEKRHVVKIKKNQGLAMHSWRISTLSIWIHSVSWDELTPVFITLSEGRTLKPNVYGHLCPKPAARSQPNPLKHHHCLQTQIHQTQPKLSWLRLERNHWVPGRQKSHCAVLIYKSEDENHFFLHVSLKWYELQPKIRESKNFFLLDGQRCLRKHLFYNGVCCFRKSYSHHPEADFFFS